MKSRLFQGTGRVALCGVLAALSLVLLWLACLAPSGRMGVVALAGLVPSAAVVAYGLGAGFLCYGAAGILGLFLLPDKGCALLYVLFFGLYPMVKNLIERLRRLVPELICKLIFFNGILAVFLFGLAGLLLPMLPDYLSTPVPVFAAGNLAFLVYDYGFSKLITAYTPRLRGAVRRR